MFLKMHTPLKWFASIGRVGTATITGALRYRQLESRDRRVVEFDTCGTVAPWRSFEKLVQSKTGHYQRPAWAEPARCL